MKHSLLKTAQIIFSLVISFAFLSEREFADFL